MLRRIFSSGSPFFSYMASKKNGTITRIMLMDAALTLTLLRIKKKSGTPTRMPLPKQISCLLVRLSMTFVFTAVRSFGTGTYAISSPPSVRVKDTLGNGAGLEQRKGQQYGIAHACPDRLAHIRVNRNVLNQDGIDCHADNNQECLKCQRE